MPSAACFAAATNTIKDIEELVRYAHLYGSKVFATVNTLLFDSEIDDAVPPGVGPKQSRAWHPRVLG